MKAQMKAANKSGAQVAVVIGPDEATDGQAGIKPLRGQGDQTTVDNQQIVQAVQEFLEQ